MKLKYLTTLAAILLAIPVFAQNTPERELEPPVVTQRPSTEASTEQLRDNTGMITQEEFESEPPKRTLRTPPTDATQARTTTSPEAQELEERLKQEISQPSTIAEVPSTPETSSEEDQAAGVESLREQFRSRKDKNMKNLEFELAKEFALSRTAEELHQKEAQIYDTALTHLIASIGMISDPEMVETYFNYQEDPETGGFVIALLKDSYVKADRGDVCLIATQVRLKTTVLNELTAKLKTIVPESTQETPDSSEASEETSGDRSAGNEIAIGTETLQAPSEESRDSEPEPTQEERQFADYTEINCYNDQQPTYTQRVINEPSLNPAATPAKATPSSENVEQVSWNF